MFQKGYWTITNTHINSTIESRDLYRSTVKKSFPKSSTFAIQPNLSSNFFSIIPVFAFESAKQGPRVYKNKNKTSETGIEMRVLYNQPFFLIIKTLAFRFRPGTGTLNPPHPAPESQNYFAFGCETVRLEHITQLKSFRYKLRSTIIFYMRTLDVRLSITCITWMSLSIQRTLRPPLRTRLISTNSPLQL